MKIVKLVSAFGMPTGLAACGNPEHGHDDAGADSLFSDSTAGDAATWDVTEDTAKKRPTRLPARHFPEMSFAFRAPNRYLCAKVTL